MQYSLDKILKGDFEANLQKIKDTVVNSGFGIIFENNMKNSFKQKLNLDFRNYVMLGICAPQIALKLVNIDENIGVFLPCNIVIQEKSADETKVSIADPIAVMQSTENAKIIEIVKEVKQELAKILELF